MNQPFSEMDRMTPGQYFAAVEGMQIANQTDDDSIEPPDPEWWEKQQERIHKNDHLTMQ